MSKNLEHLMLHGRSQGEIIVPSGMSLIIDPSLPNSIGLMASEFVEANPICAFVAFGSIRNYLLMSIEGTYFFGSWNRHPDLKSFAADMKECILEQDDEDRFKTIGFTPKMYSLQELEKIELYQARTTPQPGDRMLLLEKHKEVATPTQYKLGGNFTDAFEITTTDHPGKIRVTVKPDVDLMKFFWKEIPY